MRQLAKATVRYRWAKPGKPKCGGCDMFDRPSGSCDLVKGRIEAGATCSRWIPKGKR